jgi:hypothetical protein
MSISTNPTPTANNLRSTMPMNNPKGVSSINSLSSWRPQGRLLSTVYDCESNSEINSFEKLLNLNDENSNKFLSFSSEGKIVLWDICGSENDVSVEKISSYASLNESRINYNKGICNIDRSRFAVAIEDKVELFRVRLI